MTNSGGKHRNANRNARRIKTGGARAACMKRGMMAMQMAFVQGKQSVEGKTANGDG